MPIIKATFFFKGGGDGWSESFYSTKPTLDAALADAILLGVKLRNVKAKDADWYETRVSDDEVTGDSLVYPTDPGSHFNTFPGVATMNAPWDGLAIRLEAGTLHRRSYLIRGCEDAAIQGAAYTVTSSLAARLPVLRNMLKSGVWGMKTQNPLNLRKKISLIAQGPAAGVIALTTLTPHGLVDSPIPDLIYVGGRDRTGLFRGFYRVTVVDPNTVWIQSAAIVNRLIGLFYLKKISYVVTTFTDATDVIAIRKRDTGRPSGGPRGRRSARRLAG